jgi:hypothetical protein
MLEVVGPECSSMASAMPPLFGGGFDPILFGTVLEVTPLQFPMGAACPVVYGWLPGHAPGICKS